MYDVSPILPYKTGKRMTLFNTITLRVRDDRSGILQRQALSIHNLSPST